MLACYLIVQGICWDQGMAKVFFLNVRLEGFPPFPSVPIIPQKFQLYPAWFYFAGLFFKTTRNMLISNSTTPRSYSLLTGQGSQRSKVKYPVRPGTFLGGELNMGIYWEGAQKGVKFNHLRGDPINQKTQCVENAKSKAKCQRRCVWQKIVGFMAGTSP